MSRRTLDFLDKITRAAIRCWVKLPKDTPMAFFHADHRDGGLAMPMLKLSVPLLRIRRIMRMVTSEDPVVRGITQLPAFQRDVRFWSRPLSMFGCPIRDGAGTQRAMAHGLHTSVDGRGLSDCRNAGFVNQWMVNGTSLLTGHSFINCVRVKGNLVHTALRASRGRPDASTKCDACNATESLAHILQMCERTHEVRVARHDKLSKYLISVLKSRGYNSNEEPAIPTPAGIRYPDIVAWNNDQCVVIDTTIVADCHDSDDAHTRKCVYYDKPAIRKWCGERSGRPPDEILFTACTFNWRGTPARRTVNELLNGLGVSQNHLTIMSVRTLEQGVRINRSFHRTTTNYRNRPN